jgi:hypothetical protein
LADVVDCKLIFIEITLEISSSCEILIAFQIFISEHGTQGILRQPSKQQLDTDFGTHKDIEVVEFMLKNGKEQAGEGISGSVNLNFARGPSGIPERRNRGPNI